VAYKSRCMSHDRVTLVTSVPKGAEPDRETFSSGGLNGKAMGSLSAAFYTRRHINGGNILGSSDTIPNIQLFSRDSRTLATEGVNNLRPRPEKGLCAARQGNTVLKRSLQVVENATEPRGESRVTWMCSSSLDL